MTKACTYPSWVPNLIFVLNLLEFSTLHKIRCRWLKYFFHHDTSNAARGLAINFQHRQLEVRWPEKTKVNPVNLLFALLTHCQQLSCWKSNRYVSSNKKMQKTLCKASNFLDERRKWLRFTELNAFLKSILCLPPLFCSIDFFEVCFYDMCCALGSSPDNDSQLFCSTTQQPRRLPPLRCNWQPSAEQLHSQQ